MIFNSIQKKIISFGIGVYMFFSFLFLVIFLSKNIDKQLIDTYFTNFFWTWSTFITIVISFFVWKCKKDYLAWILVWSIIHGANYYLFLKCLSY